MKKYVLFFLACYQTIWADVFPLKTHQNQSVNIITNHPQNHTFQQQFENTINNYLNNNGANFQDPFIHVNPQPSWQMAGLGAFVSANAQTVRIFVAKKRPSQQNTINNVFNNNDLLDAQNVSLNQLLETHTEKQLLKRILLSAVNTANNPQALQGTVFIFTISAPCQGNHNDNGNFPCTTHYNQLAQQFPNVTFHIYFRNTSIEPHPLINPLNNNNLFQNLLGHMNNLLPGIPINSVNYYFRHSPGNQANLQYSTGNWSNIDNNSTTQLKNTFVGRVNSWLGQNATSQEKGNLFNAVYNHNNIHYHCI